MLARFLNWMRQGISHSYFTRTLSLFAIAMQDARID
jgi:hypothetical protein